MKGYWLVTPHRGENRIFNTTKAMVTYLKRHPACMVTWKRDRNR